MRLLSLYLVSCLALFLCAPGSYAKRFKLNAATSNSQFEKSNTGVIGVKYVHKPGGTSKIIDVYPGTPAYDAGVIVGDQIRKVNGIDIRQFDANGVFTLIAGYPGEKVSLDLLRCRGRNCRPYNVVLTRMDMNQLQSDNIFRIYKY